MLGAAFGQSAAQGTFIKRCIQLLSATGIVLLVVDIGLFAADVRIETFTDYTTMLAVAFFRGSMALGCCIIRIQGDIRKKRTRPSRSLSRGPVNIRNPQKSPSPSWGPINIRIPFEVAGFGLSFLSFSYELSRIDYKLVRTSSSCAV